MKRNLKTWLFNPFVYVAGAQSLFIGLAALALTAIIASFTGMRFDGALDVHLAQPVPLPAALLQQAIDWLSLTAMLAALGFMLRKAPARIIDIAGTQAMARVPMVAVALLGLFIHPPAASPILKSGEINRDYLAYLTSPVFIIFIAILIPLTVWMVALMYRSYSVSFNIKGAKAVWTFIAGIVLAEIISKILIYYIA